MRNIYFKVFLIHIFYLILRSVPIFPPQKCEEVYKIEL